MANEDIDIEVTFIEPYYPTHEEDQAVAGYIARLNYTLGKTGIILGALGVGVEYVTHQYSAGWNGLFIGLMNAGLLKVLTAAPKEQRKRASTIDL